MEKEGLNESRDLFSIQIVYDSKGSTLIGPHRKPCLLNPIKNSHGRIVDQTAECISFINMVDSERGGSLKRTKLYQSRLLDVLENSLHGHALFAFAEFKDLYFIHGCDLFN